MFPEPFKIAACYPVPNKTGWWLQQQKDLTSYHMYYVNVWPSGAVELGPCPSNSVDKLPPGGGWLPVQGWVCKSADDSDVLVPIKP